MYCNNNHLKLIDMKVYTLPVEIRSANDVCSTFYLSVIGYSSMDSAKKALEVKATAIRLLLPESFTLWFNLGLIFISDSRSLKDRCMKL